MLMVVPGGIASATPSAIVFEVFADTCAIADMGQTAKIRTVINPIIPVILVLTHEGHGLTWMHLSLFDIGPRASYAHGVLGSTFINRMVNETGMNCPCPPARRQGCRALIDAAPANFSAQRSAARAVAQ